MNLKSLFYDPKTGYQSASKLKHKLDNKDLTTIQVQNYLRDQYTNQVNKETRKPKIFNTVNAYFPRQNYQIDVMIYDRFMFNHYKYILVCIDVYSRYLQLIAMTNRRFPTIMENLEKMFEHMGKPQSINADNEFNTKQFNNYCEKNNITTFFSDPNEINKNAIVERVNRTVAQMIQKWRTASGLRAWYKILPDIQDNYNNTFHSTIKAKPIDVFNNQDENKQEYVDIEPKIKVGDKVRISLYKKTFDKGDRLRYSTELYEVVERVKHRFRLQNIETKSNVRKLYKEYELLVVNDVVGITAKEIAPLTSANN